MSGLNERFGVMERYTALTGLNDVDLPVFEGRYELLADQVDPNRDKSRLNRILQIQGFPDLKVMRTSGKVVRLLVSNGLGFVPLVGQLVGLSTSIVDSFVIEKLFPVSGPISFINRRLPSAFELGDKKLKPGVGSTRWQDQ
jgi:hypothetical protein